MPHARIEGAETEEEIAIGDSVLLYGRAHKVTDQNMIDEIRAVSKRRGRPPKSTLDKPATADMTTTQRHHKNDADELECILERFKEHYPNDWEAIRLCPTWHGFDEMIACLNS